MHTPSWKPHKIILFMYYFFFFAITSFVSIILNSIVHTKLIEGFFIKRKKKNKLI